MRADTCDTQDVAVGSGRTFGVLGTRFGAKIAAGLKPLGTIRWTVNSGIDYATLEVPDWVFIATPNELHYEHASHFLRRGANVFLELPGTLNPDALAELIALATDHKRRLYVDDVLLHREDIDQAVVRSGGDFVWHVREESSTASVLDRLGYHHLYLLHEALGGSPDFSLDNVEIARPDEVEFSARVVGREYRFSYRAGPGLRPRHETAGVSWRNDQGAALRRMLAKVVAGEPSFDDNQKRALWATTQLVSLRRILYPRVGIVGGGIFGATIAIDLASRGYNAVLVDRHDRLLAEASSINQYRIHRGYHYPRSRETSIDCRGSAESFITRYRQAVTPTRTGVTHLYAIASDRSLTTPDEFLHFMDDLRLPYKRVTNWPGTDLTVEVEEDLFDPVALAGVVEQRLKGAGVRVALGHEAAESDLAAFDFTVIATYANLNQWVSAPRMYQYELCEKPVLRLPDIYHGKSVVIMDGPFTCIDPFGISGFHVMGNVVHAIHHTNVGLAPVIPDEYAPLLNKGVVRKPPITNIAKFIESARKFFPRIDEADHVGSMFTIRTVLPGREKDDARPTLVEWTGEKRLMVFSGKICTCVNVGAVVTRMIDERVTTLSPSGVA